MKLAIILVGLLAVAFAKKAHIKIDKNSGDVTVTCDDGESLTYNKSPPRQLGDAEILEDPDTFRANANGGNDIVGIRFKEGDDGKELDGEGVVHMGEHVYKVQPSGAVEETDDSIDLDVELAKMSLHGEVDTVDPSDDQVKEMEENRRTRRAAVVRSLRHRRQATALEVELAVYVDQGFYDHYVTLYAAAAEAKAQSFVMMMLDAMVSDYNDLTTPIKVTASKFEIWKTQPELTTEAKVGGIITKYLNDLSKSKFNPWKAEVDHTMVISGYNLTSTNTLGVAYTGVVCDSLDSAVSVMNSFLAATIGEVGAHELAHSFGVLHDGDANGEFEVNCPNSEDLMAPAINARDETDKKWSTCSKQRFEKSIATWNTNNNNCLTTKMTDVVKAYFACADRAIGCSTGVCPFLSDAQKAAMCAKTCNTCGCLDIDTDCAQKTGRCNESGIARDCQKTCAIC